MQSLWQRIARHRQPIVFGWVLALSTGAVFARADAPTTPDEQWQAAVRQVEAGEFADATATIQTIRSEDELVGQVRSWLTAYEKEQETRRALHRADFEKYVRYAKERIDRKEYALALDQSLRALDTVADRETFLKSDWLLDLVQHALAKAVELRNEHDWRGAWRIYALLSSLYERVPQYQKLEREAVTHLRLEAMFGKDSHWEERIEKVKWLDAERALEEINRAYVEPADFRRVTESALEQMLLLADSKTAQDTFEGLADEDDRADFKARVQERLDQVRDASEVGWRDCVKHLRRVVKRINRETVRLPEALVVSELMRGALNPLDDFTTMIWPMATEEFDKHTRGDFVGVGISITKNRDDEIEVVTPLSGGPAYRIGIQAGDVITHVDGGSIQGFSINKVVETITGETGTPVTLTIRRGVESLDFPLVRERVKIQSVKGLRRDPNDEERWDYWLDDQRGIGYVRIENFQRNTYEDLGNALSELVGLKGLILDLRRNPGGLLDSAWQVSSLFLRHGDTVVSTKGRIASDNHTFKAPRSGEYSRMPLIVLVDQSSASASEIVSGSVRDNKRGRVIGERTFGKFSVQNLIPLSGSGAKLKLTTAKYYLPNGDSLHREPTSETWGVSPDIPVPLVQKERVRVREMQREADLLGPPKPEKTAEKDKDKEKDTDDAEVEKKPESKGENTEKQVGEKKDAEALADAKPGDGDAKDEEKDKLPPLKQPDENNYPKKDPQLDAALLLMRVTLLSQAHPTVAVAEVPHEKKTAKP